MHDSQPWEFAACAPWPCTWQGNKGQGQRGNCRRKAKAPCGRRMGCFGELVCRSWAVGKDDQARTGVTGSRNQWQQAQNHAGGLWRAAFPINFIKSGLWWGRWRTQNCELGLNSYLHHFPIALFHLLVTPEWHIEFYFILRFSWNDLIL